MPAQNFRWQSKKPQCLERDVKSSPFLVRKVVRAEGKGWIEGKCQNLVLGTTLCSGKSTILEIMLNAISP